jgi:hypothetical protein
MVLAPMTWFDVSIHVRTRQSFPSVGNDSRLCALKGSAFATLGSTESTSTLHMASRASMSVLLPMLLEYVYGGSRDKLRWPGAIGWTITEASVLDFKEL